AASPVAPEADDGSLPDRRDSDRCGAAEDEQRRRRDHRSAADRDAHRAQRLLDSTGGLQRTPLVGARRRHLSDQTLVVLARGDEQPDGGCREGDTRGERNERPLASRRALRRWRWWWRLGTDGQAAA